MLLCAVMTSTEMSQPALTGPDAGGAAFGIIALAYLMNTFGTLSDKLSWMLKIEPLYYTQGIQALSEHSITGWYPAVLVVAGLVCGIAGLVIFNRRDLPTT